MKEYPYLKEKQPGFLGFIFESEAGFFIIIANLAAYAFTHYTLLGRALLDYLVLYPANIFEAKNYLCLVTSGFIHRDASHLFWNMLGVFVFARIIERRMGAGKVLFIYFGALVISMLASIWVYTYVLAKNTAIIGASGAVMGLMATAMLLDPFCITYEMIIPLPVMLKGWMFLYADLQGLLSAEKDGVGHLVHLFGFFSVGALVYFLSKADKKAMFMGLVINIFSLIVFLFLGYWLANHPVPVPGVQLK